MTKGVEDKHASYIRKYIGMITLKTAKENIGRKVLYLPHDRPFPPASAEEGVITSANDWYVFVRYGNNTHSNATRPEDLTWVTDNEM